MKYLLEEFISGNKCKILTLSDPLTGEFLIDQVCKIYTAFLTGDGTEPDHSSRADGLFDNLVTYFEHVADFGLDRSKIKAEDSPTSLKQTRYHVFRLKDKRIDYQDYFRLYFLFDGYTVIILGGGGIKLRTIRDHRDDKALNLQTKMLEKLKVILEIKDVNELINQLIEL